MLCLGHTENFARQDFNCVGVSVFVFARRIFFVEFENFTVHFTRHTFSSCMIVGTKLQGPAAYRKITNAQRNQNNLYAFHSTRWDWWITHTHCIANPNYNRFYFRLFVPFRSWNENMEFERKLNYIWIALLMLRGQSSIVARLMILCVITIERRLNAWLRTWK